MIRVTFFVGQQRQGRKKEEVLDFVFVWIASFSFCCICGERILQNGAGAYGVVKSLPVSWERRALLFGCFDLIVLGIT